MKKTTRIFFGGDVCGTFGLETLKKNLPNLIKENDIDFSIVNGENTSNGAGIRENEAKSFFACGVDIITGGNHTLERFSIRENFGSDYRILRPHNYPSAGGSGIAILIKNEIQYAVINLQGRENMRAIDCPFQTADILLKNITHENPNIIVLVDFHAESVQEKEALSFFLDGRISFLCGTHTHTQTADNKILPKGTGYITDVGMIGAYNSVIGGSPESSIIRAKTQVPQKFDIADSGKSIFSGVIIDIDLETKNTIKIERIRIID